MCPANGCPCGLRCTAPPVAGVTCRWRLAAARPSPCQHHLRRPHASAPPSFACVRPAGCAHHLLCRLVLAYAGGVPLLAAFPFACLAQPHLAAPRALAHPRPSLSLALFLYALQSMWTACAVHSCDCARASQDMHFPNDRERPLPMPRLTASLAATAIEMCSGWQGSLPARGSDTNVNAARI